MKPQNQLLGFFSDTSFVGGSTARGVIAALIDHILSWGVHLGRMLRHLDDFFARPATHSVISRPQDVLSNVMMNVCKFTSLMDGQGSTIWLRWLTLGIVLLLAVKFPLKAVSNIFKRSKGLHLKICQRFTFGELVVDVGVLGAKIKKFLKTNQQGLSRIHSCFMNTFCFLFSRNSFVFLYFVILIEKKKLLLVCKYFSEGAATKRSINTEKAARSYLRT
jgi:hypothetical protein